MFKSKFVLAISVAAFAIGTSAAAQQRGNSDRYYSTDARGSCPPGLAKKNNRCTPPGQAKKRHNVGQRYDRNAGNVWTYNQIPAELRSRYKIDRNGRYYYRDGYVYQVNPQTFVVQRVISTLLN